MNDESFVGKVSRHLPGDGDEAAIRLPCLVSDTISCSVHVKFIVGASNDRIPDIKSCSSFGVKGRTPMSDSNGTRAKVTKKQRAKKTFVITKTDILLSMMRKGDPNVKMHRCIKSSKKNAKSEEKVSDNCCSAVSTTLHIIRKKFNLRCHKYTVWPSRRL